MFNVNFSTKIAERCQTAKKVEGNLADPNGKYYFCRRETCFHIQKPNFTNHIKLNLNHYIYE